jgi:arabinogalactan endo-1,4-beta-galactosidase
LGLAALCVAAGVARAGSDERVFVGVDANYSLGMERNGQTWRWADQPEDLFRGLARHGVQGFRVRLWTGEDGPNGKAYATEVVRRALAAGLEPYLVIFLSEDWADLMKQPVPAIWKDLTLDERAEAVRVYSRDVVRHFRAGGLRSHLYEIGNEIDYGICGVYPGKSTKKTPESLSRACWPDAARLILAAQAGVREADPDAKFLLHIAHWWDVEFCQAFFRFMLDRGVTVDYAGLSYFPSANIGGSLEIEQFGAVAGQLHAAINRPIIVPETAYPSSANFTGQFSRWKKSAPGYPLTDDGQRRWVDDFLRYCARHPAIHSVYYWSPEWSGEGMWKAFALFDPAGLARPAWAAFAPARSERAPLGPAAVFEVRANRLYKVPVAEAREAAAKALAEERARFGAVNTDYIKAITARELVVGGYQVHLRASLSGNLDLALTTPAPCTVDEAADALEPDSRVVVFVDDASAPIVRELAERVQKGGHEVLVHPQAADLPLKFGLGQPVSGAATNGSDA